MHKAYSLISDNFRMKSIVGINLKFLHNYPFGIGISFFNNIGT